MPTEQNTLPSSKAAIGDSVRARIFERLQRESTVVEPGAAKAPEPKAAAPDSQQDEDENDLPPQDGEAGTDDELDAAAGDEGDADEGDAEPPEVGTLRAEVERLQKRDEERFADYTRKTQAVAESRRQLEQHETALQAHAQFLMQTINMPIAQMEQIDWAGLQASNPAQYQQARTQYQNALNLRNGFLQRAEQMVAQHEEAKQRHAAFEIEAAKEIIKDRVEGWGEEKFKAMRALAPKYAMSEKQFDENTSPTVILLMDRILKLEADLASTSASVKNQTRRTGAKPPTGNNVPQVRNRQGQFAGAREEMQANPGDRSAQVNYFARKLAAERKGKRG